jgi:hypothetical protein
MIPAELIGTPKTEYSARLIERLNVVAELDKVKFENDDGVITGYSLKAINDFRTSMLDEVKILLTLHKIEVGKTSGELI